MFYFAATKRPVRGSTWAVLVVVLLVPHRSWASTAEIVGFFAEPVIGYSLLPVVLCLLIGVRFRHFPAVGAPRVVGCLLLATSWDGVAIAYWLRPPTLVTGLCWYGACPELWGPKLLLLLLVMGWYGLRRLACARNA